MTESSRCSLCDLPETETRLFVTQEAGTEVDTGKAVTPGALVCHRHKAVTATGDYVRIKERQS